MKPEPMKRNAQPTQDVEPGSPQNQQRRCQLCGQIAELIWVHGHGQCAACGFNAEECCRGERCEF